MIGQPNYSGGAQPTTAGNIGTKSVYGFMDTGSHGVDRNFHTQTVVESHFDAVRLVLFNSVAGTIADVKAAMGVGSVLGNVGTSATNTPEVWADMTWSSASSVTLAAGTTNRPSVTVSDWMQLNSIDRADGAFRPVVHVRIFVPSTVATASKWSPSGVATWMESEVATQGRPWRVMMQDGVDAIANKTLFTATGTASRWYPMAVQYLSRGKVTTVSIVSDSLGAGIGATNALDSPYWRWQLENSSAERPVEIANFGWATQSSANYHLRALDLMTAGVVPSKSVLVYHGFSPNDYTTSITNANINTLLYQCALVGQQAQTSGAGLVLVDAAPVNPSVKDWGATDSFRRLFNRKLAAINGYGVISMSQVLDGARDADGQTLYRLGLTGDGFHPNDQGVREVQRQVQTVMAPFVGVASK